MNRAAFACLLSIVASVLASGQGEVSQPHPILLSGKIVEQTGAPIPGASGSLTFFDAKEVFSAIESDQQGILSLPVVKPGRYNLTIQRAGFRSFTQPIEVTGKNDIDLGRVALDIGDLCDIIPTNKDARFYNPPTFRASGRVGDNTNNPIPNAVVVFVSFCHGSRASKTDAKGIFSLRVPQDLSSIEVRALGFRTLTTYPKDPRRRKVDEGTITLERWNP
jgi:hypothetical protein